MDIQTTICVHWLIASVAVSENAKVTKAVVISGAVTELSFHKYTSPLSIA